MNVIAYSVCSIENWKESDSMITENDTMNNNDRDQMHQQKYALSGKRNISK